MTQARRIGLVGCVKQKQSMPSPAKDLYTSPLFRRRRRYVERTCDLWFVLSAEHGLVEPGRVLTHYDRTLKRATVAERRAWTDRVLHDLNAAVGALAGAIVELHAGAEYREYGLEDGLRTRGAAVEVPARGLSIGRQLAFYARSL